MYRILKKKQLSENVFEFRIEAPRIAKKAHAGQFLMVRPNNLSERVPFTFANWDAKKGWVEFIFLVVGKTTRELSWMPAGDFLTDVTGPLGCPTEIKGDNVVIIGGGVGLSIAYPVARQCVKDGKNVTAIMGARSKSLLILEEQFRKLQLNELCITTDDGSYGEKGVVTAPLERLLQTGKVDSVFCVGPVSMMKFSTLTCKKYNVPVVASLNPIMVDGTGMCGCCRVEVGGETKFACVDGPDFDASEVDWDDLTRRQLTYLAEEKISMLQLEGKL